MAIDRDLSAPLDPRRIQQREGSAGKKLSYLTTHDVKRTANRIFGYDGWSYTVNDLVSLGEEPFKNRKGLEGIRVGYRATVTVTIGDVQRGDVGYGDAQEYNGSRITPHELAAKEAVSDALKRCLSSWGDQFGLVLYGADPAPEPVDAEPDVSTTRPARRSNPAAVEPNPPAAPPAGAAQDEHRSPRPGTAHAAGSGVAVAKPADPAGDEQVLSTNDLKLPPEARKVITAAQVRKMWTMARGYKLSDEQVKEIVIAVGGVDSSKLIPRAKFEAVLGEIELTGKGVTA